MLEGPQSAEFAEGCNARNIRCADLDELSAGALLTQVGSVEVTERIYRPGEDHSDEIAQVRRALEAARTEMDRGGYAYPGGQEDYERRTSALSERLASLSALPVTAAGYEHRCTGETFGRRWERSDTKQRRRLMIGAGFEVRASRTADGFTFAYQISPDLAERAQAVAAGERVELTGHAAIQAGWEAAVSGNGSTMTAAPRSLSRS